jgi:hypothetical protein
MVFQFMEVLLDVQVSSQDGELLGNQPVALGVLLGGEMLLEGGVYRDSRTCTSQHEHRVALDVTGRLGLGKVGIRDAGVGFDMQH